MSSEELDIITDTYQSSVRKINANLFYLNRKHEYSAQFQAVDVFGNFNVYAYSHIRKGELRIKTNSQSFEPEGDISLFIPKLSLIQWYIQSPHLEWHAYVSESAFAPQLKEPTLFSGKIDTVTSIADIFYWLTSTPPTKTFSKPETNSLAHHIKDYIDLHFQLEMEIAHIAKKFELSDSQLTKIFKNEFNISPVKYRTNIRVFQSMYDLLRKDESIIDIAFDTGFNDLSRFNKQFKNITKTTPSKFKF